jgi:hypothetical protein
MSEKMYMEGKINIIIIITSRYFRNKGKEYLKAKIMNLKLTVKTRISQTCIEVSMTL